jgi:GLPGLI family protein
MRFKYLVLIILFINISIGYSQGNNKGTYLVTYIEKRIASKEEMKKYESFPKFIRDKLLKEINIGEEKILFLDQEISFYSLKENIKKEQTIGDRTVSIALSDYYKDLKKEVLVIDKIMREKNYIIKEKLHPLKWTLIKATRKINSLVCKKAISEDPKGRKIVAWYTEEVKISNGPYEYGGLPGLIVELKSKYKSFKLKEIEKTNTSEKINFPSLENAITMKEFKKQYNPKNKVNKTIRYN